MMKYVTCALAGGLGNQCFQVFATLAFAARHADYQPVFVRTLPHHGGVTVRPAYWDSFFTTVSFITPETFHSITWHVLAEDGQQNVVAEFFHSTPTKSILLQGYFQSALYFEAYRQSLQAQFWPPVPIPVLGCETLATPIAIHIRRGDYVRLAHVHTNLCEQTSYYQDALVWMKQQFPLLHGVVFSDDLAYAQTFIATHLKSDLASASYVTEGSDSEQLHQLTASGFQGLIMANSSFSWMGAYFSHNPQLKVVAPQQWFTGPFVAWQKLYQPTWHIL